MGIGDILTGGIGSVVGGAIGLLTAKQKQSAAKRQAAINNELARNDTTFGAFNKNLDRGHQVGGVSDEGPSALGGTLQGGLAGLQQGLNVYDKLRGKSPPAVPEAAQETVGAAPLQGVSPLAVVPTDPLMTPWQQAGMVKTPYQMIAGR